ncbi:hypothetical protein [uncultured Aquimarina sp.]|uniref:hypothetical protein n=1 Tax=uncultured Aquimarina sp. TaxID=575652 RepID=UPI002626F792|nr:hypothetical protein [uncultured Aquimarina sp.]
MIKRKEIIYSDYSGDYIKRLIERELSTEPKLEINLIKWFKKFEKHIEDGKKFSGSIQGNKIKLHSKTVLYWPKTIIEIEEGTKTKLTLNYRLYWLYASVFIFLVIMPILMIFESGTIQVNDIIIPLIIFGVIAMFGRRLQKNTKKILTE